MNVFKFALLVICFCAAMFAQQTLRVTASLPKKVYLLGEQVDLFIEHTNVSSAIIRAEDAGMVSVSVVDENGKKINYRDNFCYFSPDNRDYLPNESTYRNTCISDGFGKVLYSGYGAGYFETGEYTVIISSGLRGGHTTRSKIKFKVRKPTGDELFVFNSAKTILSEEMSDASAEELARLHEQYPESVYSQYFLILLKNYYAYTHKNLIKADKYINELAEKYSWTSAAQSWVRYVLEQKKTKQERIEFLQRIKENSKSSKVGRMYEKQLQEELKK